MTDYSKLIACINAMKDNTLHNYVIAGLNSSLLSKGTVRYFENTRNHQDQITPHSHRFDFTCLVLEGTVENKIWCELYASKHDPKHHDQFQKSILEYKGEVGKHDVEACYVAWYSQQVNVYSSGQTYSMTADQIHSITFSKGAKVLFFEEPTRRSWSHIIEPYVNERVIQTYETKPYMFDKGDADAPI